jgi:hypothetical protein
MFYQKSLSQRAPSILKDTFELGWFSQGAKADKGRAEEGKAKQAQKDSGKQVDYKSSRFKNKFKVAPDKMNPEFCDQLLRTS